MQGNTRMNMPIFADTASIEVQDERALELLSADYSYVQFRLAGFAHLQVYVTDHRASSVVAFHKSQPGSDPALFANLFNTPAYILVSQAGERAIMIDLYAPAKGLPINTLWIGACQSSDLPIHHYHLYHEEPVNQGWSSFLAVYQNDPEPFPVMNRAPAYLGA